MSIAAITMTIVKVSPVRLDAVNNCLASRCPPTKRPTGMSTIAGSGREASEAGTQRHFF